MASQANNTCFTLTLPCALSSGLERSLLSKLTKAVERIAKTERNVKTAVTLVKQDSFDLLKHPLASLRKRLKDGPCPTSFQIITQNPILSRTFIEIQKIADRKHIDDCSPPVEAKIIELGQITDPEAIERLREYNLAATTSQRRAIARQ